jgi:nucleoside-diphosphate kinase
VRQENVVESFRTLCGPHDPDLAKIVRKNTIRSVFGTDKVRNAVHCTDLPEDGIIEVEYFFNIL